MLGLKLREEFQGTRLKGATTVDFDPQAKSGALKVSATDFLRITYPSHDLLGMIEAIQPNKSDPVVVLGDRGQGKSHILATIYHICSDPEAGKTWLAEWSKQLKNDHISTLAIRDNRVIIAESLHHQRYRHLWDLVFIHPAGARIRGKWEASGTPVPGLDLMRELFTAGPTLLILDEFQTWFDGLTDTKQYPWKKWAFNYIQILSEIAKREPDLLTLIVSIRDSQSQSEAYQQIHRVNPVRIDFKGQYAKTDRRRLLLHRLFENRRQIPNDRIQAALSTHIKEYFRLFQIPQADREQRQQEFCETWPFSPLLLELLDDQVLVASAAQETRDLIRILVDVFKYAVKSDENHPLITAGHFSLTDDKSGVASLLDSVASPVHRDLRTIALRNLAAVQGTTRQWKTDLPHCEELIGSLWLRSLTMGHNAGASENELQLDVTWKHPVDDNSFSGELAAIRENSFNIHEIADRFLFKTEENPQAKLLAHARNDKLFNAGQDIDYLAKEIRMMLAGSVSQTDRVIVLKPDWLKNPWEQLEQNEHPNSWDSRLTTIVVPYEPEGFNETMGTWIKKYLPHHKNAVRFLFSSDGPYLRDKLLMLDARCVYLAGEWTKDKEGSATYSTLKAKYEKMLRKRLENMFRAFAVLDIWNYAEPVKCQFHYAGIGASAGKVLEAIDQKIREDFFVQEDFEDYVQLLATNGDSVAKLLKELKEPRAENLPCIPWIGEEQLKEKLIDLAAQGKIAINIRGTSYQALPAEDRITARNRIKGKIGRGKELDETTLHLPDTETTSGGTQISSPLFNAGPAMPPDTPGNTPHSGTDNPFEAGPSAVPMVASTCLVRKNSDPTSGLNLLGQIEKWGVKKTTKLSNVALHIDQMTGTQLEEMLRKLPDGVKFSLELEKEEG